MTEALLEPWQIAFCYMVVGLTAAFVVGVFTEEQDELMEAIYGAIVVFWPFYGAILVAWGALYVLYAILFWLPSQLGQLGHRMGE